MTHKPIPRSLPKRYHKYWKAPWLPAARKSLGFRRHLKRLGLMTPNFSVAEYKSKDGARLPIHLRKRARDHCFRLEVFRHAVGDKPMPILSGYRSPSHNRNIGGASQSRHMSADATDFSKSTVDNIGRDRWFRTADAIFADGGVGNYPGGNSHLDSRGYRARWSSF